MASINNIQANHSLRHSRSKGENNSNFSLWESPLLGSLHLSGWTLGFHCITNNTTTRELVLLIATHLLEYGTIPSSDSSVRTIALKKLTGFYSVSELEWWLLVSKSECAFSENTLCLLSIEIQLTIRETPIIDPNNNNNSSGENTLLPLRTDAALNTSSVVLRARSVLFPPVW